MKSGSDIKILIVDDVSENIQVAMNILREESYTFSFAVDGEEALNLIDNEAFDLILLDVMMPKINGFDVCRKLKKMAHVKDTPVIFLTAKSDADSISEGFEAGGVDYLTKPFHANELLSRVKTHLELSQAKIELKKHNKEIQSKAQLQSQRLIKEIEENQREMIYMLMEIMESTSDETGHHIRRVAEICSLLASKIDYLDEEDEQIIFFAAPMHDLGKVAIPKEILHKPGKLTVEEFDIMKTHAQKGYELLKKFDRKLTNAASIIAYHHHEKWDGSGYPRGLKGDEIHIYGRIVALADVFDALSHKRQYKDSWSLEETVQYIKDHSGTHFDPDLVSLFVDNLSEIEKIAVV